MGTERGEGNAGRLVLQLSRGPTALFCEWLKQRTARSRQRHDTAAGRGLACYPPACSELVGHNPRLSMVVARRVSPHVPMQNVPSGPRAAGSGFGIF